MAMLFDYHINYLSDSNNRTNLPFSLFGLTQQGISHEASSIGNQDAGSVFLGKNIIVGVVSDGCTTGTNLNGKSSNQIGANITSYLVCRVIRKLLIKNKRPLDGLEREIEIALFGHYKKIINSINPWKFERDSLINNFFTSTFIAVVIYKDEYALFHCGDGNVIINNINYLLESNSGDYFSNNLLLNQTPKKDVKIEVKIRKLVHEKTKNLNSIFISTDGFIDDNDIEIDEHFSNFLKGSADFPKSNGFVDFKSGFRAKVIDSIVRQKQGRIWPYDDATFIYFKKINQ